MLVLSLTLSQHDTVQLRCCGPKSFFKNARVRLGVHTTRSPLCMCHAAVLSVSLFNLLPSHVTPLHHLWRQLELHCSLGVRCSRRPMSDPGGHRDLTSCTGVGRMTAHAIPCLPRCCRLGRRFRLLLWYTSWIAKANCTGAALEAVTGSIPEGDETGGLRRSFLHVSTVPFFPSPFTVSLLPSEGCCAS